MRNGEYRRVSALISPTGSDAPDPARDAAQLVVDEYRCPEEVVNFAASGHLSSESGYFRFGTDIICYGQCSSGTPMRNVGDLLHDSLDRVGTNGSSVILPFDPLQVVNNLRRERYATNGAGAARAVTGQGAVRDLYYQVRPLMPVPVRKHFQKFYFRNWDKVPFPIWPVDRTVEKIFEQLLVLLMKSQKLQRIPFIWFWPEGAKSCSIMTHDVETSRGAEFCQRLMDLDDSFGIKSSFQVVPEKRYPVPYSFLEDIRRRGFEVNVQDLNHDGLLFSDWERFLHRAARINSYAKEYRALGFRGAVLYRNPDWYDALEFSYDMSIPNVAHLDPQRGGCCTVLPFFIGKMVELPVTTTQDYTLFQIFDDYSIRLWEKQIALIREKHGLISFIVHPDYIIAERPRRVYTDLLRRLCELRAQGETWLALPREVADWWRIRSRLTVVKDGDSWLIKGDGSERARIAYAVLQGDHLSYEVEAGRSCTTSDTM